MAISMNSTDEEVIQFLVGRKAGNPIPNNGNTLLNPFRIDGWIIPENTWFLCRSPGGDSKIHVTVSGYWTATEVCRITSTRSTGRKTTLEFYNGRSPFGEKTEWVMHEYRAENGTQNINSKKDYVSLCRLFQQNDANTSRAQPNATRTRPRENDVENTAENMYENCDFVDGDFLELNDLGGPDTSSANSDNSSRASGSYEYFDPNEFAS